MDPHSSTALVFQGTQYEPQHPRCGTPMEIVAWITKPSVVDAILRHRQEHGLVSPFEARAPPAA